MKINSKHRVLSIILSVLMVLSLMPVAVFADDGSSTGAIEYWTDFSAPTGTTFSSLDEALTWASSQTDSTRRVVIAGDYTLSTDISIPDGVYLDVTGLLTISDGVTLTVPANAKRFGVWNGGKVDGNGQVLVYGRGNDYSESKVMVNGTMDLKMIKVPEGYVVGNNGNTYFAAKHIFEITLNDGSVKKVTGTADITSDVTNVKLLDNYNKSWTVTKTNTGLVLDLNGFTWGGRLSIANTEVTIKNGTVKYNGSDHGAVYMYGSAVVTIASDAVIDGDNGMAIHGQSGKLTVNGTVRADGSYAIAGNGDVSGGTVDSIDIIVNDGAVISAPNGIGIYHPQKGTVTVNGGSITGHTGIEMCAGKLVVNGGKITSAGANLDAAGSLNAILDGAAISLINRNYPGGIPSAEINGGIITASGTDALAIKAYDYTQDKVAEWTDAADYVKVSAGTFSSNVGAYVVADSVFTDNGDGTYSVKGKTYAAEIDGVKYDTLAEAIAAAKDGDTVTLLADCSGNGIQIPTGKFAVNGLTVDFGGHTYTVGGVLVGSSGTGTNAFQLLRDNYITFKNGTIAGVSENTKPAEDTPDWHGAPAMVIQNYANLTLKSMSVIGGDETVYTMSNNNGDIVIEDSVITAGNAKGYSYGPFAFDVCRYSSYPSVTVTVRGNSEINGDIEISGTVGAGKSRQLNIEDGKINGEISVSGNVPANVSVSGGTFTYEIPEEYCAEGFIPTKNADGTYGVKVGSYVAKIGETKYETLPAAIAAVKTGETIQLLADVDATANGTTKKYVSFSGSAKNVTVDLGGHKIFGSDTQTIIVSGTNWIIQNGEIVNTYSGSTGSAVYASSSGSTIFKGGENGLKITSVVNGVRVSINNGTASVTVEDGVGIAAQYGVLMNGSPKKWNGTYSGKEVLTVNGGSIYGTISGIAVWGPAEKNTNAKVTVNVNGGTIIGDGYGIAGNGASGYGPTDINVTGGTVISKSNDGAGIYHPQTGTLNITGGNISGAVGVSFVAGTLNISGDDTVITATGEDNSANKTGDGSITDGAAVSIVSRAGYKSLDKVSISGGKFTSEKSTAVKAYTWSDNKAGEFDNSTDIIAVSGGSYSTSIPEDYCADGFIPTQNEDGTYGVKEGTYVAQNGDEKYVSLQAAIDAAKDGDTVTLIADVDVTEQIVIDKSITLDLAGYTVKNTVDIWNESVKPVIVSLISIDNGAEVTITGNGTVAAKENDCYTINVSKGKLTIENGKFIGNVTAVQVESGSLVINGGEFSLLQKWDGCRYLINCLDEAYKSGEATVAIYGGSFEDFDPNNSPEAKVDGKVPSFAAEGVGVVKNADGSYTAVSGMEAQLLDANGKSVQAYATLAEAFANVETGYTVRLLKDITLNEQINIVKALNGLTLDGNGYTINCATTTDPMQSGGSALYFGNASDKLYCTGIKIKDLTMEGTARFAIFLCGGTSTEFTNVKISGNYYIAVNLYGTHGAVMTNCDISNSNTDTDKYVSAIWSNVSSANPLVLNNTKVSSIAINTYTTANKLEPKIFVNEGSVTEVHTFDDGSVSGNIKLCVSTESKGEYTILIYDAENAKWIPIPQYTITTTVSPVGAGVLTGGGTYEVGTEVTITATANGGYEFLGWYLNGERVTADTSYTFKASADASYVAMFKGTAKAKLSVNIGMGKVSAVYGGISKTWRNNLINNSFAMGTSFTLTAVPNAGYRFLYWINSENKVVSENAEYTFILGSDTALTACYAEATQSTEYSYVVFRDNITKDIHWSGDVEMIGGVGTVEAPAMLSYTGFTFVGWYDADGNELTVDENGMFSVTKDTVVIATYKAKSETYTVTVDGTELPTKYEYRSNVTVTADEINENGDYFAGWYIDDTCVSMKAVYSFIITSDVSLTTRYTAEKPEATPIVTLTVGDRVPLGDGRNTVEFNAAWSLPEGYTLTKAGIMYTVSDENADKLTVDNIGSSGIYNTSPASTASQGNYGYTLTLGKNSSLRNLYVRAYITYMDAAGKIVTVYSGDAVMSPAGN